MLHPALLAELLDDEVEVAAARLGTRVEGLTHDGRYVRCRVAGGDGSALWLRLDAVGYDAEPCAVDFCDDEDVSVPLERWPVQIPRGIPSAWRSIRVYPRCRGVLHSPQPPHGTVGRLPDDAPHPGVTRPFPRAVRSAVSANDLRVRIPRAVLAEIEAFLTDRGSLGVEGTGLVACRHDHDSGWWRAVRFVAPDQRARRGEGDVAVEVTDAGKVELAAALQADETYLVRVHSHPGEAFHSRTDDANPALTHEGALSVVVPYFGLGLRHGLDACAIYRRADGGWRELASGESRERWVVTDD